VENKFQLRVNGPERIQPSDRLWNRKCCTMRKVDGYGVSKMTDPAMLIFELIVPVAGGLKGERQYKRSHHHGHNPVCSLPPHVQSTTPTR
jgi:hypothetical protein